MGGRIVVRLCDEDAVVLAAVQDAARRRPAMPCGHPGLPLRATAWGCAGRDGRMAVLIEQQDGRCDRWFRRWTIGRLEVDIPRSRVTVIEVWASLLLGQQILQLAAQPGPIPGSGHPIGSRKSATAPMRGHASAAAPSHEYNPRSSTSDHDRNPCHLDGRTGARRLGNPRRALFYSPNARLVVISVLLF